MSNLKNNRWLTIATIILLIANIITLTMLWSHKNNHGDKLHPEPVFEFLTKELQLDEQQQKAYKELRDQHQSAQRKFQDSIRKAKDALFGLLQQQHVPDSLLQEYSRRSTALDQQMDIITFKHFQQVRALCNPAQQKKFDEVIRETLRRMAGPGGHPPPGAGNPPPGRDDQMPPPQQ